MQLVVRETAVAEERGGAVLAVLHDQSARSHGNHFLRRSRQIFFLGQHLGLGIVDQQNVHQPQRLLEFVGRALNPEIHRIAAG